MTVCAWVAFLMLFYVYLGYFLLLKAIARNKRCDEDDAREEEMEPWRWPRVSVLLTVYNEEDKIKKRIENILSCRYPRGLLEVLVASDGSTDGTDSYVRALGDKRVRLYRPEKRVGKTDTQNQAVAGTDSEIIVFTDADTTFDPGFIEEIVRPFRQKDVGGVDGHLLFTRCDGAVSESQGFYWSLELRIRSLESCLGWLAVGSGACLAVRKSIFRPMVSTVGEDCLVPLDVVRQGYRMIHARNAIAYDRMPSDSRREFRTRVRMTLRNWQGTWMYPDLLNPVRHPGTAFALWSHKLLRWMSPLFLLLWIGSGLPLLAYGEGVAAIPGWLALVFSGAAVMGWLVQKSSLDVPAVGFAYSFCLANLGMAVGVIRALSGRQITTYR